MAITQTLNILAELFLYHCFQYAKKHRLNKLKFARGMVKYILVKTDIYNYNIII